MADRICSIPDCGRPVHSHSMCSTHVKRWQRTGDPHKTASGRVVGKHDACAVDGCDRPHAARGYCAMHYTRTTRKGDPGSVDQVRRSPQPRAPKVVEPLPDGWYIGANGRRYAPASERFWSRVTESPDGCWIWSGPLDRDGYGAFAPNKGGRTSAHQWSYAEMVGDVPEGLELDHLCRVRACVNPYHLDPVTTQVNNERRAAASK